MDEWLKKDTSNKHSNKTTEIYTHVSHTAKNIIVSPLDNLDLKNDKKETI
ncbi:MAG: hypothetical protein U9P73_09580 [Candidatus Cloacimonadota bacterium]|nr:hypothetical protein [Candidatus Cloacimonadota bacterium]